MSNQLRSHTNCMEKPKIESYKNLLVWQKSMVLVELIYKITNKLPIDEQWGLKSQMRRSAVSVPSNIAEGYGRQTTGNYKQFLNICRGSLYEIETQVLLCMRLNYLNQEEAENLLKPITEISKMLYSLIIKIK